MTQEEKQLLLKDLCARLSYGVKIATSSYQYGDVSTLKGIVGEKCYFNDNPRYDGDWHVEKIKPYLRPMSSMTDEEADEYDSLNAYDSGVFPHTEEAFDWLNKNMFDYRGLIPMGLALEAPEVMYKTE